MNRARRAAVLAACFAFAACGSPADTELTVFAAASLTDVLVEVETAYENGNPGIDLVIATDSSAGLRTQIQEGAPADIFLSADTASPEGLAEAGLTEGDPVDFAGNSLALVVPSANQAGIQSPADLATDGVQVIAAGPEVPITEYVAEVIANLAALPDYPDGFAEAYAANVVSEEENVRAVLGKIELNEGDAGFVYQTDALASDDVAAIEIPEEANTNALYAGCVIADSDHLEQAEAFLAWLAGAEGQAILGEFGFVAP